jgi:hypothetical protein
LPLNLLYTYKKEIFARFKRFDEKNKIFFTDTFLKYLKSSSVWMSDGTFLAAPVECAQLFVIYGKYLNHFFSNGVCLNE